MSATALPISFMAADTPAAQAALHQLASEHTNAPVDKAAAIVALGGDGAMLQALHAALPYGLPVYGMNLGSIGFLLNAYRPERLLERIMAAQAVTLHPLEMQATDASGAIHTAYAFNEVSLLRETHQAAKLRIKIDKVEQLTELICDGALVATPVGSTAYNYSAHGPILPLTANVLALTPISAFRPRRWRGALLPLDADIEFDVLEADKRPVSAVADFTEIRTITALRVRMSLQRTVTLLFDADRPLAERILSEQFAD